MKNIGSYPNTRLRRNRKKEWSRRLVQENTLSSNDLIWPILLHNYTMSLSLLWISVLLWGIASVSLYTVTLAYLGERINIAELSIATSVFIIVYELGEFLGPAIIGSVMDYTGNIGFIYTLISFTFLSLFIGIIRIFARKGTDGI